MELNGYIEQAQELVGTTREVVFKGGRGHAGEYKVLGFTEVEPIIKKSSNGRGEEVPWYITIGYLTVQLIGTKTYSKKPLQVSVDVVIRREELWITNEIYGTKKWLRNYCLY